MICDFGIEITFVLILVTRYKKDLNMTVTQNHIENMPHLRINYIEIRVEIPNAVNYTNPKIRY